MSWREFQLRLAGYRRQEKDKWRHTREIAYCALAATGAIDPKKVSKEKFMTLDNSVKKNSGGLSDRQKELMKEAQKRALNGG